ncbi:undecaprenyl-diphosphate phosphatase [Amycolatopsis rubida]|uniref:Undecaprenyl-diphosphate phosphatase n=1 Tax=Amycolatopsis rubida TaxID=112413 RepID=A0ABX0BX14_9PSEU|nr:undecaprenyl-diphosphate phosphatase [Amycolatopsis rubida]
MTEFLPVSSTGAPQDHRRLARHPGRRPVTGRLHRGDPGRRDRRGARLLLSRHPPLRRRVGPRPRARRQRQRHGYKFAWWPC